MSHFALIDDNGIVQNVIVAEQAFIDALPNKEKWIQTSYNTYGGINIRGVSPLRKNYASKGFFYDSIKDAFIAPKPFSNWILNEETCLWEPPIPIPQDGKIYSWDEDNVVWKEQDNAF